MTMKKQAHCKGCNALFWKKTKHDNLCKLCQPKPQQDAEVADLLKAYNPTVNIGFGYN